MNVHGFEGFCTRSKALCLQLARWENQDTKTSRRIWVRAVILDKITSASAIHEWDESNNRSPFGYVASVVYLCRAMFDHFASRSEQNTSWPYSDIPEIVFARTILADGSGVSFQDLLKSKKELSVGDYTLDSEQLTELWQIYNHF